LLLGCDLVSVKAQEKHVVTSVSFVLLREEHAILRRDDLKPQVVLFFSANHTLVDSVFDVELVVELLAIKSSDSSSARLEVQSDGKGLFADLDCKVPVEIPLDFLPVALS